MIACIVLVVLLVIQCIVAEKFEEIACMKGHDKGKRERGHNDYFWWCLALGIVGWAMVIALPDRNAPSPKAPAAPAPTQQGAATQDDSLPVGYRLGRHAGHPPR